MEPKLDLRVKKTYQNLFAALQELLCEKGLNDITVTELCNRAQTRKATFYKHFSDKNELFAFFIQVLQREYKQNFQTFHTKEPASYYAGIFLYYLNFLEQHESMISKMMQNPSRNTTFELLSGQIQQDLVLHLYEDRKNGVHLTTSPELLAAMYTGVIVNASRWWIAQKDRMEKEEVAGLFERLVRCFQENI